MKLPARYALAGLVALGLLSACSSDPKKDAAESDPAMTGALEDQIMVDPGLAGQSGGAASASGNRIDLPPEQRGPEAIAAAREEAARMAGGALQQAPEPVKGDVAFLTEGAATAAQIAEQTRAARTDCAARAQYSMSWAAKLPDALAVYPRGAVQEAAGVDDEGCSVKVVSFLTPVAIRDVVDFYWTRVRASGYDAHYRLDGDDHVLGGRKGASAYLVYARKLDNGLTEVDLLVSGR
ncbi:MAG: hypothetical protein N2423_02980 [Novosphingobium sp.]|nr:hypothetical protein [Novosphingobium sp.]